MMGTYLNKLGFIGWLGDQIGARMGGLDTVAAFAALTGVYALTHYLFASGTAHTASMFAVFLGVGLALGLPGVPPTVFLGAIPTLMGCLTHYTHYGNGPAPLYFGSGYVELGTWWRAHGQLADGRADLVEHHRGVVSGERCKVGRVGMCAPPPPARPDRGGSRPPVRPPRPPGPDPPARPGLQGPAGSNGLR